MTAKPAKRGVIYARFSSALQKDRSIGDQTALCRDLAEREDITIVEVYADRAITGTSIADRMALIDMMADAKARKFDVLIVECLDRLGRDQADLHGIRKRFEFYGIEIRTVHEGVMDETNMALRGLFAEMFSKQLAKKVKRGHSGLLREGRIPGSMPYGYRRTDQPGYPEIDPARAAVVRRIYEEYASGRSPRLIASGLNRDGIASPSGKLWNPSTFVEGNGSGTGMIGNRVYLGEIRWNQTRKVQNPESGRKVNRPGAPEDLVILQAPHLRIISDELFEAANRVRQARSYKKFGKEGRTRPAFVPRNESVLAGLLRCGTCGSHMVIGQNSRGGGPRMICSQAYRNENVCQTNRSYDLAQLEAKTFDAMEEPLSDPELFAEYIDAYVTKRRELARSAKKQEADLQRRLSKCLGSIQRYLDMLDDDTLPEDEIKARLRNLQAEKVELEEKLQTTEETLNEVSLHPEAIKRAKSSLATLHERLGDPKTMADARAEFRTIIDHVIVHPTRKRMPYEVTVWTRYDVLFGRGVFPTLATVEQMAAEEGILYFDRNGEGKSVSS